MIGGIIVQVIDYHIEVLSVRNFDRTWRRVETTDVWAGDSIWWQSYQGYLSRPGEFTDRSIGSCKPSIHPESVEHE